MRISDWSSDVCSSDLAPRLDAGNHGAVAVDDLDDALLLPERQRLALGEADIEGVGELTLDTGRAHPRQLFQRDARCLGVDSQDRPSGLHAWPGTDILGLGARTPFDHRPEERRLGTEFGSP